MIIGNVIFCTLTALEFEATNSHSAFYNLIYNMSQYREFLLGVLDNGSMFMLSIMIPSIISIKYKSNNDVFMAGTILGSVTCFMYVIALYLLAAVPFLSSGVEDKNLTRYVKATFITVANVFFLE